MTRAQGQQRLPCLLSPRLSHPDPCPPPLPALKPPQLPPKAGDSPDSVQESRRLLAQEVAALQRASGHPNVLGLHGVVMDPIFPTPGGPKPRDGMGVLLEKADRGTLWNKFTACW